MNKYIVFLFFFILITNSSASNKEKIIENLKNTKNLDFNFEQNVNGKIESGNCVIRYPKKIFCIYDSKNKKVLVSNGRSLVIKTINSYYIYPIKETPLNLILNKEFLLKKIKNLDERIIDGKFINYNFSENENEINLFFDKNNFNLIGWQTLDMYQNLNITYLSSIKRNLILKKNTFTLPSIN